MPAVAVNVRFRHLADNRVTATFVRLGGKADKSSSLRAIGKR